MHKDNYILRLALLQKWLKARKGRLSILSVKNEIDKHLLYRLIHENRISIELLRAIENDKKEIEELEKECIKKFEIFKRFIKKGEGRTALLSKKLGVKSYLLRDLSYAKGDGRYLLLKYGAKRIVDAIREIERGRSSACYQVEKLDVNKFINNNAPKSLQTLQGVMSFAESVKKYADMGNHDGSVICEIHGNKYKIISIGFDTKFDDMCRSHICDKSDPHLHGLLFATLGIAKNHRKHISGLMAFSQTAPCPNCAKRLIKAGVSEVYCYFEPELMDGLNDLGNNHIPVYKYMLLQNTVKKINKLADKVA
ncbi:hypothetical protein [Acinetobacter bereziniae]|uniref:hypothetical protein n=1 Tax=Acinetobacter bereziniae TaxID=106648 RepID=UPI00125009E8|nr:hypothetical protein [Acinetobacter bereziniae]MCU4320631.1 hypothetical protein [Acinetobacter bereziniae]